MEHDTTTGPAPYVSRKRRKRASARDIRYWLFAENRRDLDKLIDIGLYRIQMDYIPEEAS